MTLKIEFTASPFIEPEAYLAVCKRIMRWSETPDLRVTVHVRPRLKDGFLEWLVVLFDGEHRIITLGMIERTHGAGYEFHS